MAYVVGKENVVEFPCPHCKSLVGFERGDMRHYAHDVDGINVYVDCPSCHRRIDFYGPAARQGWIPRD